MDPLEQINKKDAPLHVDVQCWRCKKPMALSNALQLEGRNYCFNCSIYLRNLNPKLPIEWTPHLNSTKESTC